MAEEDGFLSRWSKRKRAVAEEAKAIPVSAPALPEPVVEEAEPEFDISTLPSLEELTGTSDMSVFLQKGVPEALKKARPGTPEFRAALKDALESTPALAVTHGVLDFSPTDHWGYRADTGVVMKVVKADWKLEK